LCLLLEAYLELSSIKRDVLLLRSLFRRRSLSLSATISRQRPSDLSSQPHMWNQLGVFGSRVVEAVFVSEDKTHQATGSAEEPEEDRAYGGHVRSEGRGVEGTVGAEELEEGYVRSEGRGVEGTVGAEEVRMEGSDVKTLIAKRMGISKGEVDTRLISLHQKGELDGTADRSSGPSDPSDRDRSDSSGNVSGNISLTKKDLEDFERAEAEARNGTPSQTGTPFKLAFKPAVLGNPSATPRTPRTPPAPARPARSAPARTSPPARPAPSTPAPPTTAPAAEG
jgi:hypothetical protein